MAQEPIANLAVPEGNPRRAPGEVDPATDGGSSQGKVEGTLFRRLMKNASMLMGGKGAGALMGLLYLALAAHALGAKGLGMLVLIHSYSIIVTELTSFKSWQAIIRYGAEDLTRNRPADLQRLITFTFVLDLSAAALGMAIGMAAVPFVGPLLGLEADVLPFATAYCLVVLLNVRSTATGVLRLFDRFDLIAAHALIVPALRLTGVVAAWGLDGGLWAFVTVWFVSSVVSGLVLPWLGWRELRRQELTRGFDRRLTGLAQRHPGIWRFVWIANFHSTLNLAGTHLPILAVGGIVGPAAAGLYKIAREIAGVLLKASELLNSVIYPELARLVSERSIAHVRRIVLRSILLAGAAASVFLLVVVVFGRPLLASLFGPEFAGAYELLWLLTLAGVAASAGFAIDPTMYALGRPDVPFQVKASVSVLEVCLLIILLREIGLVGAGISTVVASLLTATITGAIYFRIINRVRHDAPSTLSDGPAT